MQFAGLHRTRISARSASPWYFPRPPEICPIRACLVTGISPLRALADDSCRVRVHRSHPRGAGAALMPVGSGSLRFDDEVTRYPLRNFRWRPRVAEWHHAGISSICPHAQALRPDMRPLAAVFSFSWRI